MTQRNAIILLGSEGSVTTLTQVSLTFYTLTTAVTVHKTVTWMKRSVRPPEKKPPWVAPPRAPFLRTCPRNPASAPLEKGGATPACEAHLLGRAICLQSKAPPVQVRPPPSPPSLTDADGPCGLKALWRLPALSPPHPSQAFPSVMQMPASTLMPVLKDPNECSRQVWEKLQPYLPLMGNKGELVSYERSTGHRGPPSGSF